MSKLKDMLSKWSRLHRDEGGAVALLMMASIMITFMLGLVIFDAGFVAEDKLEVQAAADTASWSQSAVEARAMNMMAFANVGKRITVGIISYYEALWVALAAIAAVTLIAMLACWAAYVALLIASLGTAAGALEPLRQGCTTLTAMLAEQIYMMAQEGKDLNKLAEDLMSEPSGYFQKDAEAFTKYQDYMHQVAPWWSWGEGFVRGFRNGAIATSWPVPSKGSSGGGGLFGGSLGIGGSSVPADTLPILKATSAEKAGDNLCNRMYGNNSDDASAVLDRDGGVRASSILTDIMVHTADYGIKTLMDDDAREDQVECYGLCGVGNAFVKVDRYVYFFLMGVAAIGLTKGICKQNMKSGTSVMGKLGDFLPFIAPKTFGQRGWPYMIRDSSSGISSQAVWLRWTSNLTFSYRRGTTRYGDTSYEAFTAWSREQGNTLDDLVGMTEGVWAVSRSEISYQFSGGAPDLWHPSWVARMRPVSIPGEWGSSGATISEAFGDALPLMARGAVLEGIAGSGFGMDVVQDGIRMMVALQAMSTGSNMDGVAK